MSLILFLVFTTAVFGMNDTLPTLGKLLNDTANSTVSEYLVLLEHYPDLFNRLSPALNISTSGPLNQDEITILVPSNDAFAKIPYSGLSNAFRVNNTDAIRAVLEYHVLNDVYPANSFNSSFSFLPTGLDNSTFANVTTGQVIGAVQQSLSVTIFTSGLGSRSTLTTPDLRYSNGIVHIIDTFLTPPASLVDTTAQFNLTAFAGALAKTNILNLMSTIPDITIFSPTNAAFETLGSTLETMPDIDLEDLLRYHIVIPHASGLGPTYSPDLTNATQLSTILSLPGGQANAHLTITAASNSLFVNSAIIAQTDILLSNGVLHVIDNVLSPNESGAPPIPSLATQLPVISGAELAGGLVPFTVEFPASATAVATALPTVGMTESFGVGDVGEGTQNVGVGVSLTTGVGSGSSTAAAAMTTMTMATGAETGKNRAMGGTKVGTVGNFLLAVACSLLLFLL